ncbi:hypothetical protein [Micromonospora sp. LOL_023]|uniref:hypothetical protein n=1 Tax=Micromonospora sp. LOL_023 TaxID=3345418 RepID=UPI003A889CE7
MSGGNRAPRAPRPEQVDLTAARHPWQEVPMPGANLGFHLTRLASRSGAFVVHGHFPPGFSRDVAGGYLVDEEFVVLAGELHLGDATYRRGDLTYIPAGAVRTRMTAPGGATVLAWFGGPAVFHPADQLPAGAAPVAETVHLGPGAVLLDLPGATWTPGDQVPGGATGDVVSADLSGWRRLGTGPAPRPGDYVRVEK